MPTNALVCGLLLILVGVGGYFAGSEGHRSLTALIPAVEGVLLVLCGVISLAAGHLRKHFMHAAAVIGLLGVLAAGGRLGMVLATGGGSPLSIGAVVAMLIISLIFLVLCIMSFRAARRNRTREEA